MKISVIAVGKLKEKYLKEGIDEYKKRLSRFCDIEIIEVEDEEAPDRLSEADKCKIKRKEAERVLKKLKDGTRLIVLDVQGKDLGSEEFSDRLKSFFVSGGSHITFVIGGSLGVDEELLRQAHLRFSLSKLTFPHQLVRLVLMEQVFRAFKIMNGEPYHK